MSDYSGTLPDDLASLILRHVDSVPHLEAVVLIWENDDQPWTEAEVARRVYLTPDAARSILRDLQRRGLLAAGEGGSYAIAPDRDARDAITRIVTAYRQHVSQVATLIHSRASQPVREFARAFEIRGKDDKK